MVVKAYKHGRKDVLLNAFSYLANKPIRDQDT